MGPLPERANSNAANLLVPKRLVFHYALFAHDQPSPNQGSAGVADLPGMNILATFGNNWAVDPATNHSAGSRTEQAFNLMHELGHNLGLRHGGNDNTNCKPNYLSVMSYLFSLGQLVSNAPLDYSRSALATLNKGSLSEPNGISQSDPPGLTTIYGPRGPMQGPRLTQTGVPVDWNFNGVTTDTGVNSDISGGFGCETPGPGPTLNGFNDWNALVYSTATQQQVTGLRIQQETPPVEPTERDVIQTRLDLLEGIDNAIQRLIKSEPKAMIQMPKGIFDTTHIAQLLKTEQLEADNRRTSKVRGKGNKGIWSGSSTERSCA